MIELPRNESVSSYFEQWYCKEKKKLAKGFSNFNTQIFDHVKIKLVTKLVERLTLDLNNYRFHKDIQEKKQMLISYKELLGDLKEKILNLEGASLVEVDEEIKTLLCLVEKEDLSLVLNEMKEFNYKKMQTSFNLYKQNEQEYLFLTMSQPTNRLNELKIRLNLLTVLEEDIQFKKKNSFADKLLMRMGMKTIDERQIKISQIEEVDNIKLNILKELKKHLEKEVNANTTTKRSEKIDLEIRDYKEQINALENKIFCYKEKGVYTSITENLKEHSELLRKENFETLFEKLKGKGISEIILLQAVLFALRRDFENKLISENHFQIGRMRIQLGVLHLINYKPEFFSQE